MDGLFIWLASLFGTSHQCSAASPAQAFLLSLLVVAVVVSIGGGYVYKRFIRTQPKKELQFVGIQS